MMISKELKELFDDVMHKLNANERQEVVKQVVKLATLIAIIESFSIANSNKEGTYERYFQKDK